jgi:hypothetical protein
MKIAILPGSFKPPHMGHLHMIEELLRSKSTFSKIYIFLSYHSRPLEPNLYGFKNLPVHDMFEFLKPFDKKLSKDLTKDEYIHKYQELVQNGKIPVINAKQAMAVWNIYLDYLSKKYPKEINTTKIIVITSYAPSPVVSAYGLVNRLIKKGEKPSNIYLIKSKKNSANSRFDFLTKRHPQLHVKILSSPYPNVHSTLLRKSILDKNYKDFLQFVPSDLPPKSKKEIWKILTTRNIQYAK